MPNQLVKGFVASSPASVSQTFAPNERGGPARGIAVIGFGSLIWSADTLELDSPWHTDGPFLPVEYARVSKDGRLTLVIVSGVDLQKTLWAYSRYENLDDTRENLRVREGTVTRHVEYWEEGVTRVSGPTGLAISTWARKRGLRGVVWTALPPKDTGGLELAMPAEEALGYLSSLQGQVREAAREYVTKTPPQIDTKVRKLARERLRWQDHPLPRELFV